MIGLAVAAAIAALGFGLIVRQWKRGGASSELVLAALPFALVLVTMPLSFGAWRASQFFQQLSESPQMGPAEAAAFFTELSRGSRTAVLLCAALLVSAAVLQEVRRRGGINREPNGGAVVASPDRSWRTWVLAASALLLVPAIMLDEFAQSIPRLILGPMLGLPGVAGVGGGGSGEIGQAGIDISARLHAVLILGVVATIVLIGAGGLNVLAVRAKTPRWVTYFSAIVLAVAIGLLSLHAVELTADIRMFAVGPR